ncbi:MAG: hypothetical protein HS127_15830 [Planctomycetia bacterium]|nr:hypothetical protein [Planctomycetia bacterium]
MHETNKGTPQGGVIFPLLANLIGDIIDKELERLDISLSDTPMISLS